MVCRTLAICLILAAGAGAGPDQDPKDDPAFQQSVRKSIEQGVGWLLSKQTKTGKFPGFKDGVHELGMHALATLTVIKGGRRVNSPEVREALTELRRLYELHRSYLKTYEASVTLMVLDAKYSAGQRAKKKRKKRKPKISAKDLEMANALVAWLQTKQRPEGLWGYPDFGMDLSNTQYAALGLWSAHRLGVAVDKPVVRRMLAATLAQQQKNGPRVPFILDPELHRSSKPGRRTTSTIEARGWQYKPEERGEGFYPYSGSMTAAGIAILALVLEVLGPKTSWLAQARDRQLRRAMWEGLAWLQANWDLKDNPGHRANWVFYWIYGLERCARLSGVEYIGRHDWYYEGARRLIPDQRPDGSWPKNQRMRPADGQNVDWWSDQVDTCFAILFLTRSTPEVHTPPPALTGAGK